MASNKNNYGFPPPPPPPYLYGAPSQGTHANNGLLPQSSNPDPNAPAQHHAHAQPPVQSTMHFSNPQLFQHQSFQQLNPASSYSYSQYQYYQPSNFNYQAQYYQQTPYYSQGSYTQTPQPPPPPPPPPPRSNIAQQIIVANNSSFKGPHKFDKKESSRRSLPSPTKNISKDQPKKINDKMVQKYSGRGLKTITISGPGLRPQKFKICVGNHPDDVQMWIDERKRRFPRQDGSHRNNGGERGGEEEGGRMVSEASAGCKRSRHDANEGNVDQKVQSYIDTTDLVGGTTFNHEAVTSRLSSLLEGYDSSSSEDENTESKRKTATDHIEPPLKDESVMKITAAEETSQSNPKRICKYYQRGKCRHGDSCRFLHSNEVIGNSPHQRQIQKISLQIDKNKARNRYEEELKMLGLAVPVHGKRCFGGEKVISSTSLLHKLLQRDKERERRLTLQLLRYIVDCDYFQDGDTKESYCDGVGDTRTTEANLDLK